jgi:hypothetical protein
MSDKSCWGELQKKDRSSRTGRKSQTTIGTQCAQKETKMKFKSLFFGICFALSTLVASAPASAWTVSAFSSFHVRLPIDSTQNPYNCITESYGAVINNCSYSVTLVFNLPLANVGFHYLYAQNYVHGTGKTGATCTVWSFDGDGNGRNGTTNLTFNPNGVQTLVFDSADFGNTMTLDCSVPTGAGIGAINYTE